MGWRISFGVGPLRYSAPLTSRRRTTRRYVAPQAHYEPPGVVPYDRRLSKREKRLLLIIFGSLAIFIAAFVVWGILNPTP